MPNLPGLLSPPASTADASTPDPQEDGSNEIFLIPLPVRSGRPSSPGPSVVSLTSSAFANSFQYLPEYGRIFNTRGDLYILPADNKEIDRLSTPPNPFLKVLFANVWPLVDTEHVLLKLIRGSNYCGPVRDVLSPSPGQRKALLDLG